MDSVAVLLTTYNGGRFLAGQLDSLKKQTSGCVIYAHDDGSSDDSVEILRQYGIEPMGGQHLGPAKGFFYLMEAAGEAEAYAFCDQDDKWDEDKLEIGLKALEKCSGPALYACSSRLVAEDGSLIDIHRLDSKRTVNSRLFYASIAGNTVVFNKKLRDIAISRIPEQMIMHDSWMVKLCLALGGELIIDEEPHIDYLMHGGNTWGMELNLKEKMKKFARVSGNDGEAQEIVDICSMFPDMVTANARFIAEGIVRCRSDKGYRKEFLKNCDVDFDSRGFNEAFRLKVMRGNL